MEKLWEFYETLNELVYVADMDTYEMVYMNRHGRELTGLTSREDLTGKHCYEILQQRTSPCPFCTNSLLKPGEFHEWIHYNPVFQKTCSIKDTKLPDKDHNYRLELCIDISIQEQQKQAIQDFTTNEALVNDALRLALSAKTPHESMKSLLQYMGEALHSERFYIFEENARHTFDNTYEWCAPGVTPEKDNLQDVPYEVVSLWYQAFYNNQNIIIKDIELIKDKDPLAYQYLYPQNIHSLVVNPLISNNQVIGFYGVDNPPLENLNHISIMFEVLGHFIVSILRRRDLINKLETLSYYDQLTGARNRHCMNEFVLNVNRQSSIGILYCDVMGLKKVNDTKGHLEGDALLIRAFQALKNHFPEDSIFRIGGDEFLVLQSGIAQKELEDKVTLLRADMPNHNLNMALGLVWKPHCDGQILNLLKEADESMYADKRKYYEQHPQNRRRTDRKN